MSEEGGRGAEAGAEDDATSVAPLARPTRPAWRPMEIRPAAPRGGVTVFGTRLTYLQAAIGGGIVLLVLLLVIVLAAKAFGGDDRKAGTNPKPGAMATTQQATQPSGTAPSAGASQSAGQPPSSPAGSSGGTVRLPAGWVLRKDPSGFSVPLPAQGVETRREGSEVYFSWNNRLLLIDQSTDPKPGALSDWEDQERSRSGGYSNYQKIKIVDVPGYFEDAADWEFLYTTGRGNAQHAVKRNIIVNDHQAYSISWYTSPGDWAASQSQLQVIYQGFKPKS